MATHDPEELEKESSLPPPPTYKQVEPSDEPGLTVGSSVGMLHLRPTAAGGPNMMPDRQGAEAMAGVPPQGGNVPHILTSLTHRDGRSYVDLGNNVWDDHTPEEPTRVMPPLFGAAGPSASPVYTPRGGFPNEGPDDEESPDGFPQAGQGAAGSPLLMERVVQGEDGGKDTTITAAGPLGELPGILVVGCGGGGSNMVGVVDSMGLAGARTVSINTDMVHLGEVEAQKRVLVGKRISGGHGTGGDSVMGRAAVESCSSVLAPMFSDHDMVLMLASLGGGTGTGATPELCSQAREAGSTVIVLATLPFRMEAARRAKGYEALPALRAAADNVLLFDMDHLMEAVPEMPVHEALGFMNELIAEVVRGLVEATTRPSRINIDFADLRSVLTGRGLSQVLISEVESTDPVEVVHSTLENPFADLDHTGATGALIHITGGDELTLASAQMIADMLTHSMDDDANVILGARIDPDMDGRVKVIALFTGIEPDDDMGGEVGMGAGEGPDDGGAGLGATQGTGDLFSRYGITGLKEAPVEKDALRLMGTPSEAGGVSYFSVDSVSTGRKSPASDTAGPREEEKGILEKLVPIVKGEAREDGGGEESGFEFILDEWERTESGDDPLKDIMIK